MKLIFHIVLYFFIALMVLQNHLFIALVATIIFTYRVGALWLLPLSFCIDGYFGAFAAMPIFSMFATGWYVLSEFIRPQLTLQFKPYETTA